VPDLAVIVTVPLATPVAIPAALMDAMAGAEELHCTDAVISVWLPSENRPVAVNCCVAPAPIAMVPGVTCNPVSVAGAGVGVGLGEGVGDDVGVGVGLGFDRLFDELLPPPPHPAKISPRRTSVTANTLIFTSPPSRPRQGQFIRCVFRGKFESWALYLPFRTCTYRREYVGL